MGQTNRIIILGTTLIAILSLGTFSGVFDEAFAGGLNLPRTPLPTVGPIGDYRCWNVLPQVDPGFIRVDLEDQFGTMSNVLVGNVTEFCASAIKNGNEGQFGTRQHFTAYNITGTIEDEIHSVFIPQFQLTTEIRVNELAELLVPTNKTDNGFFSESETDLHYKCYFIEDPQEVRLPTFTLETQFDQLNGGAVEFSGNFRELLFCNPVIKTHFDEWNPPIFGAMIQEHLICYEPLFEFPDPRLFVSIENQFTFGQSDGINLDFTEKICFEALKDFVPVGGTLLSVDKASLLLAAAQTSFWWLIPVIASGIGIGLVVIRQSKK